MAYRYVGEVCVGERGEGGCVCVRCLYEDGICVSKVVCEGVLRRRRRGQATLGHGQPMHSWCHRAKHIAEQGTPYLDNIVYEGGVLVWERCVTEWNTCTVYHSIPHS